jgi:hypothetical protein
MVKKEGPVRNVGHPFNTKKLTKEEQSFALIVKNNYG